jgi:hypothetical protein
MDDDDDDDDYETLCVYTLSLSGTVLHALLTPTPLLISRPLILF